MTNLNDLLNQALSIYSKSSDGCIPVYVNGTPVNIKLELINSSKNNCWINMTFTKDV